MIGVHERILLVRIDLELGNELIQQILLRSSCEVLNTCIKIGWLMPKRLYILSDCPGSTNTLAELNRPQVA